MLHFSVTLNIISNIWVSAWMYLVSKQVLAGWSYQNTWCDVLQFLTFGSFIELWQVMKNKTPRGWELKYARRNFFPYWRSTLSSRLPVKVIRGTDIPNLKQQQNSWNKLVGQGSPPTPDLNLGLLARVQKLSNHQPTRTFGSAALPLLKMLRNAWQGDTP